MEFTEVVRRRRMVRNFDPERPVDPDILERILQNALHAPSAGFSQGWAFLVLDKPEDVARFWAVTTEPGTNSADSADGTGNAWLRGMRRAPVLIVPLSCERIYRERYAEPDKRRTLSAPYWDIDTGMASLLMLLTVTDEGLGACFFGIPVDKKAAFRAEFGVPEDHDPIGVIAVGHRAPDTPSGSLRRGRRGVDEVVHRGRW